MNTNLVEQDIQAKGLTAPRVTLNDVKENIVSEYYFTAAEGAVHDLATDDRDFSHDAECAEVVEMFNDQTRRDRKTLSLLTFCVLVLKNGVPVTGSSFPINHEDFDEESGRKIARQNAINKVWPLMDYQLKSELAKGHSNE